MRPGPLSPTWLFLSQKKIRQTALIVVLALASTWASAEVREHPTSAKNGQTWGIIERIGEPQAPEPLPGSEAPKDHIPAKYDVSKIGERGIGGGLNFYSLQKERALGQQLAAQVEAQTHLVTDPKLNEYVNRVAQNLVRHSDAKVPFTVKILDNDEVNAFALPGGFLYVNSGLIMATDNEAELSGVLAHEIAHVAARHATKNETRMQLLNLASMPLIFVGGPAGYAVREVMGLAVPVGYMKFSRDAEREADLLGMEYAYAAGYDPAEMVHFFETLNARKKQKLSFIAKAFMTHPMTKDRIKRAQKEIATMLPSRPEYVVTTSEFDGMKARLMALENEHRIDNGRSMVPVLRRRPPSKDRDGKDDSGPPTLRKP